jgi:hypothetical protein
MARMQPVARDILANPPSPTLIQAPTLASETPGSEEGRGSVGGSPPPPFLHAGCRP